MKKLLTGASTLALLSTPAFADCNPIFLSPDNVLCTNILSGTDGFDDPSFNDGEIIFLPTTEVEETGDAMVFGNNNTVTMSVDSSVDSTNGSAFVGGSGNTLTVIGAVDAEDDAVDLGDNSTVNVSDNSSIESDEGNAIAVGDNAEINVGSVAGALLGVADISGDDAGIDAGDDLVLNNYGNITGDTGVDADNGADIDNNGTITGLDGAGVDVGQQFEITNNGTITGDDGIVGLSGVSGDDALIENFGTIEGEGDGIDVDNFVEIVNGSETDTDAEIIGEDRGIRGGDDVGVTNYGSITADDRGIAAGQNFTLDNFGSIEGDDYGVDVTTNATINNYGSIDSEEGRAVEVGGGSTVNNGSVDNDTASLTGVRGIEGTADDLTVNNYGTIEGADYGVKGSDQTTVNNYGSIDGTDNGAEGIDIGANGSVINGSLDYLDASITGSDEAIRIGADSSVTNFGTIEGGDIAISGQGDSITVTNAASGEILASDEEAIKLRDDSSVTNAGLIQTEADDSAAVEMGNSFIVTNSAGATIENTGEGEAIKAGDGDNSNTTVEVSNATGGMIRSLDGTAVDVGTDVRIENAGTIDGQGGDGIVAETNLSLVNSATGKILAGSGADDSAAVALGSGIIDNSGEISSTSEDGFGILYNDIAGGSRVDNRAGGLISGETGIKVDGGDAGLVINSAGVITGTEGTAISLNDQDDQIRLEGASSVTNGDILMGDGENTLDIVQAATVNGDVVGGDDADEITMDRGASILGDVDTGEGADLISLQNGSYITGDLDMGAGSDEATLNAGTWINGNVDMGEGSDEVYLDEAARITGDLDTGAGSDMVTLESSASVWGDIDTDEGQDSLTLNFGSSAGGDIYMGVASDILYLNTIDVAGTVDMGESTGDNDVLQVLGDIGMGIIAFSDHVETYDDTYAPDTALFTGNFLIVADPLVFAGYDALTTRQTFQQTRNIMDASATPGWYGMASGFGGESDFSGGDLLVGYNAENFGAFLSFAKADTDAMAGLHDFERRTFAVGVKGFAPVGAGMVTGMAYLGRGDGDIDSDMAVTGKGSVDDTSFGLSARFDLLPAGGEGLGFSAEVGASRIKYDSFDPSSLGDAIVDGRDVTASYISLETGFTHALSGGLTVRPFLGAAAMFSDADNVTLSAPGPVNFEGPTSTTFATGGDDDQKMLRLGAELVGAGGWTAKLEGQFDDNGDATGIVSFGMNF